MLNRNEFQSQMIVGNNNFFKIYHDSIFHILEKQANIPFSSRTEPLSRFSTRRNIMNKLLWFVGGCLAGFITATVLGTDDGNSFDQSDMMVDNEDVPDEDMPEAEDVPLFS